MKELAAWQIRAYETSYYKLESNLPDEVKVERTRMQVEVQMIHVGK